MQTFYEYMTLRTLAEQGLYSQQQSQPSAGQPAVQRQAGAQSPVQGSGKTLSAAIGNYEQQVAQQAIQNGQVFNGQPVVPLKLASGSSPGLEQTINGFRQKGYEVGRVGNSQVLIVYNPKTKPIKPVANFDLSRTSMNQLQSALVNITTGQQQQGIVPQMLNHVNQQPQTR